MKPEESEAISKLDTFDSNIVHYIEAAYDVLWFVLTKIQNGIVHCVKSQDRTNFNQESCQQWYMRIYQEPFWTN